MQYLNKNFWRMIVGFVVVVIISVGLLYLSQFYGKNKSVSPENYLAGQKAEVE